MKATESIPNELAQHLIDKLKQQQQQQRLIVAISGVPGAGKTYLAQAISEAINNITPVAVVLPMDGFHLSKAELRRRQNSEAASSNLMARRGAHWTFDADGFVSVIRHVRHSPTGRTLAPSFDHAEGDPVADAIAVEPSHRVILVEGLYALVSLEPWREVGAELADELWWVEPQQPEITRKRLIERHVRAGLAADEQAALLRVQNNDEMNGVFAEENRLPPTRIIYN